jgi:hypothetical protein
MYIEYVNVDKIETKKVSPLLQGERYKGTDFFDIHFVKEMVLLDYSVLEQLQILNAEVHG